MALRIVLDHVSNTLRNIEYSFLRALFGGPLPPPALAFDVFDTPGGETRSKLSLKDIIGDGFLFAVPKHRRTIEKRLKRKFGYPDRVWKMLVPKKLLVCNVCGHDHEIGLLCPHCYETVMNETKSMQKRISETLNLKPIENEVIVLYDGEQLDEPPEFWKGKRIVEMQKPRPAWFSKNLLQKSTQKPATTTDVKPTELA